MSIAVSRTSRRKQHFPPSTPLRLRSPTRLEGAPRTSGLIDNEPAERDERLFRLLLARGNAAVTDGLDAIAGPDVTTLSLGRGNA